MAARFSNTQLRVPPGFATILEGLAREVLRDQPEDIPKYAARYFDALLKQREETGMDPAEWAAKLEEKYYNYQTSKAAGSSAEKEPAAEIIRSKENSKETETEPSLSAETTKVSTTHANVFEEAESTENTEEDEKHEFTEERGISMDKEASDKESINNPLTADLQTGELSGTQEEKDTTIYKLDKVDRATNENDTSSALDHDVPQSASTDLLFYSGVANLDVCAQELGIAEGEAGDKYETAAADNEIVEGETNTDAEDPVGVLLHSGLTDVDICATEYKDVGRTVENATAENDTRATEEESFKPQPDQTLTQSSTSQFETPEGTQQEGEDQEENAMEEEESENQASSEEKHESLTQIEGTSDTDATPKDESLVEISFEDVPEVQQMTEVLEKQTEVEGSADVLQTDNILDQQEESKEVTAETTEQIMFGTQHHNEPETEAVEKEFNVEEEEMESQLEASDIMKEKVATHSNLNDSDDDDNVDDDDDEKGEGARNVTASHQIITEAEDETDHTSKGEEIIKEGTLCQDEDPEEETKSNASDMKEDEMTDAVGEDKEDTGYHQMKDEDINDSDAENHPSRKSETIDARAQYLSEDHQGTPAESEPDNTVEETEVTSEEPEKETEEGKVYSEIQEKSDEMCEEESVSHTRVPDETNTDHQEEEETPTGSEKDSREKKTTDKQEECSRPQEEEDIMDIPLDDPEANRAAAKIQAGFRGHMTRKKMKPEDKAEVEEVSSTGDVLNGSQGDAATGGSGAVESDTTSVPEQ